MGCLNCQSVCPENRHVLSWIREGAEFSSKETSLLVEGVALDQLPAQAVEKLNDWDIARWYDGLARNLRAVLETARGAVPLDPHQANPGSGEQKCADRPTRPIGLPMPLGE